MHTATPPPPPQPQPELPQPPPPPSSLLSVPDHGADASRQAVVPGSEQAPPAHGQVALLLAYLCGGLLLVAIGAAIGGNGGGAAWLVGAFLCCHAAIVAASWLPQGVLSHRFDAFLDRWVADIGGGFYGLMALAMFLRLELGSIYEDVTGFDFSIGAIGGAVLPWVIGFSLDSLLNGLMAAIWPPILFGDVGPWFTAAAVGIAWGLFVLGSRVFPQPAFMRAPRATRKTRRKRTPPR